MSPGSARANACEMVDSVARHLDHTRIRGGRVRRTRCRHEGENGDHDPPGRDGDLRGPRHAGQTTARAHWPPVHRTWSRRQPANGSGIPPGGHPTITSACGRHMWFARQSDRPEVTAESGVHDHLDPREPDVELLRTSGAGRRVHSRRLLPVPPQFAVPTIGKGHMELQLRVRGARRRHLADDRRAPAAPAERVVIDSADELETERQGCDLVDPRWCAVVHGEVIGVDRDPVTRHRRQPVRRSVGVDIAVRRRRAKTFTVDCGVDAQVAVEVVLVRRMHRSGADDRIDRIAAGEVTDDDRTAPPRRRAGVQPWPGGSGAGRCRRRARPTR